MAKEFKFTDADFQSIKKLVMQHTGINLSDGKQDLELLSSGDDVEMGNFVNSVTTNLTSFFREPHHFDYLKKDLLPQLMKQNSSEKVIRIWSAGCSTGEEPYSIAMTVKEVVPENQGWDVRILATDLDTNVLETASKGVYTAERVNGISEDKIRRWFYRGKGSTEGYVKAADGLRDMIIFKQLNLMGNWPVKPGVDVIFCRNVVIYFDKPTQSVLFDRYANILKESGHLFIGHSETLYKVSERFQLLGKTIYQRMT